MEYRSKNHFLKEIKLYSVGTRKTQLLAYLFIIFYYFYSTTKHEIIQIKKSQFTM